MIKLKDLIPEELQNSQGEQTDFKVGDLVKDINPDCPHHGSRGEVKKVSKGTITFIVSNNGGNYKEGDELEKTVDQMIKIKESVNETLPNRVWTDLRKQYSANELKRFFEKESVNEKVARPFSEHLRKAQDEIEYMISYGPTPDGDSGVYDKPKEAIKLLQTAQKALGKIK